MTPVFMTPVLMTPGDRAAFQGAPGAFSHEAALDLTPGFEPTPFESFAEALDAVRHGACSRAVMPVHNLIAGPVPQMQTLLPQSGLVTLDSRALPIRMQLLALPGVKLDEIEAVASHPMALRQCQKFLASTGLAAEIAFDTAGAAQQVALTRDRRKAAIASRVAAELYGLAILRPDIHDDPDNWTRFLVLARPDAH